MVGSLRAELAGSNLCSSRRCAISPIPYGMSQFLSNGLSLILVLYRIHDRNYRESK